MDFKTKEKSAFKYYSDGREALHKVAYKKVTTPAIWISVILPILGIISSLFGGKNLWDYIEKLPTISINLTYALVILVLLTLLSFLYLERRSKRSLEIKYRLHQLAHELRDVHMKIGKNGITNYKITDVSKSLVDEIQQYFDNLIPGKDIKCSIRLLAKKGENLEYVTVARSRGFNKNRRKTTVGIQQNRGEAKLLESNDHNGVIIYSDIERSLESDWLFKGKNFEKFPHEINSLMVAPINSWDGESGDDEASMIGLLYICSKDKNVFAQKDVDSALFVADILASMYSLYFIDQNAKGALEFKSK